MGRGFLFLVLFGVVTGFASQSALAVPSSCLNAVTQELDQLSGAATKRGPLVIPVECQYYGVQDLPEALRQRVLLESRKTPDSVTLDTKLSAVIGVLSAAWDRGAIVRCEARIRRFFADFHDSEKQARVSLRHEQCREVLLGFERRWNRMESCEGARYEESSEDFKKFLKSELVGPLADRKQWAAASIPLDRIVWKMPQKMHSILSLECDKKSK